MTVNQFRLCPNCGHHRGLSPDRSAKGFSKGENYGNPAVCSNCNHRFPGWERRRRMRAPCKWCGRRVGLEDMEDHLSDCRRYQEFRRQELDATLGRSEESRPDRAFHWEGARKECEHCGEKLSFEEYREHLDDEHPDAVRPKDGILHCPYCDRSFGGGRGSASSRLHHHIVTTHDEDHGGSGRLPEPWPDIWAKTESEVPPQPGIFRDRRNLL